jgi:hypothetical protein
MHTIQVRSPGRPQGNKLTALGRYPNLQYNRTRPSQANSTCGLIATPSRETGALGLLDCCTK